MQACFYSSKCKELPLKQDNNKDSSCFYDDNKYAEHELKIVFFIEALSL